jgi:hypothetical protein
MNPKRGFRWRYAGRRLAPSTAFARRLKMRYLLPLFVLATSLGVVFPSQAEEFKSPKGFSFTYPDGWQVASKEQLGKIAEEAKKKGAGMAPGYAVMLFGPRSDDFSPNMNVIVVPEKIVLNAKNEKDLVTVVQTQFASAGKTPAVKPGHITIGGTKAYTMAYEITDPASGKVIRTWMVMLPGEKRTYTITCAALKSQWDDVWKGFHDTVLGFQADVESESTESSTPATK